MIHLDNHISKAKWCCDSEDGNSWFGDSEFDADKWRRAWGYMANYVSSSNRNFDFKTDSLCPRQNHGRHSPASECVMNFVVQTKMRPSTRPLTIGAIGTTI